MKKRTLRRKVAELEAQLMLGRLAADAPAYVVGSVILGPTGGPTSRIEFPILTGAGGTDRGPVIDLPGMGYRVTKVADA